MQVTDDVVMTREILEAGLSSKGAFNGKQMKILKVTVSWNKGWKDRLIGNIFTKGEIEEFIRLKDTHFKHKQTELLISDNLFTSYDNLNLDLDI